MNPEKRIIYSLRGISLATFLGGPIAASYLIKRNFEAYGQKKQGRNALILGIVFTVVMIGSLLSLPEHVVDKIPNFILPVVYTGIIAVLVEWLLGEKMHKHEDEGGEFYSLWKAFVVGIVFMVVLLVGTLGAYFLKDKFVTPDFDTVAYDAAIAQFTANEEKALAVFSQEEITDPQELKLEVMKSIGLWVENKGLVGQMNAIENLPEQAIRQNELLLEYCNLRIELNQLAMQSIGNESAYIYTEMDYKAREINELLAKLTAENSIFSRF